MSISFLFGILFIGRAVAVSYKHTPSFILVNTTRPKCTKGRTNAVASDDTVYALSTCIPDGGCGVAVIRITGPESLNTLKILTKRQDEKDDAFTPRRATLRPIFSAVDGDEIDRALTIYFPGPNSYTGENTVELHIHGSKCVAEEIFESLRQIATNTKLGLRQAERGEFTRRAFYNGKLDLTQAEGIKDLIASDTVLKRRDATLKVQGHQSKVYQGWADECLHMLAHVEARIDFYEESVCDIESEGDEKFVKTIRDVIVKLKSSITKQLYDRRGELVSDGIDVVLLGPPNAGKSTFMNTLFERDVSIVSSVPGTTRDVIQLTYKCNHLNLQVMDTAGIRNISNGGNNTTMDDHDLIEAEGVKRALNRLTNANVILFFFDHTNPKNSIAALEKCLENINEYAKIFVCLCKSDLAEASTLRQWTNEIKATYQGALRPENFKILEICSLNKSDIDSLVNCIHESIQEDLAHKEKPGEDLAEVPFVLNQRHKSHLQNTIQALDSALRILNCKDVALEVLSEYIREILDQLGYLVGRHTKEDVIDEIFKTFCIGK